MRIFMDAQPPRVSSGTVQMQAVLHKVEKGARTFGHKLAIHFGRPGLEGTLQDD
jgi:hypothetical protein